MQDDGIHTNLRYTQQAYVATVMKVTHATLLQFPHSQCVVFKAAPWDDINFGFTSALK